MLLNNIIIYNEKKSLHRVTGQGTTTARKERSLDNFLKRLSKPAKAKRISDATGDRIHVDDNGQTIDIPIIGNQVK